jgi:hypothetical protein
MKKYIYGTLIGLMSLSFGGCETDILDKQPRDKLSSGEFWQSESDFEMALTAVYGSLQEGFLWDDFGGIISYGTPNLDVLTDNAFGQHNYWSSQAIVQGNISPSTGGYINEIYNISYQGIARANTLLQQLNQYEGTDMDAQAKATLDAEAKFIRGYYYYLLYFFYGSVPIVTEPLNLENQIQAKSPAEEVLNQSISDLDFAIANLPDQPYSTGHAVKTSAQALKARVLMYAAYGSNGIPDLVMLAQARDLTSEVMNAGYSLDPNFENVFRAGTQEASPEIIFSIKYLAPNDVNRMDIMYGDWLVISPLQNLVDAFEEGDPRLEKSIFVNQVEINGNTHSPSNNVPTGYGVKKFLSPDLMPYGYATPSEQDWVMLRYAEVLLMYAEAQNELSGPDGSVHDAINAVRNRVGMPDVPEGLSQVEMREAIRHERRVELAFEGLRYYDLKRWRIAEEVLNNVTDGILEYNFEERFYQWPLPQTEIDKSQGELVQNENY